VITKQGSLVVVGTGIKSVGHITLETQGWIAQADTVLYCVTDPATAAWIERANPHAEDLSIYYADDKLRAETYREMTEAILRPVRAGLDVCAVFYGHPGVFVSPSHEAIRIARDEGYRAGMLPAISALDCLFADLGIDPALPGCQMFEATDYLLNRRRLNPQCHVILWQVGVVGDRGFSSAGYDARNLPILVEELQHIYGREYEVVHYQAAIYPICPALVQRLPLSRLMPRTVTSTSTLYIPPKDGSCRDEAIARRLGLGDGRTIPPHRRHDTIPYRPADGASALARLLADMSRNPRLLAQFVRNPEATVARYGGLSAAERDAVLDGRPGPMRMAMLR
jgi:hypothetical protein